MQPKTADTIKTIDISPAAYQQLRRVVEGIDALFAENGIEQPRYRLFARSLPQAQYFGLSPNGHDPSTDVLEQLEDDERFKVLYREGYELVGQHHLNLELTRHQFYLLGNRVSPDQTSL